jgi:hypothetical protein
MTEPKLITLNLTLKELQQIDKFVEVNDDTLSVLMKIKNAYPVFRSPAEEAYKDCFGEYPSGTPSEDAKWGAFLAGYQSTQPKAVPVEEPQSKSMDEVVDRLENKYKQAEENAASYITDEVVDRMVKEWEENPPEFLKFELGKTLEALITRWWCDVFGGINQDWDMETAIDDLVDRIQLWLPKEQSHEGTQSVSVIDLVDGYNDALTKIKSKLRNKKWVM